MRPTTRSIPCCALLLALLAASVAPATAAPTDLLPRAEARLRAVTPALIETRRDLHRHPEVSGEEDRTAGVVAARLEALGLDVRTGVGGHGVVATLRGAHPGPRVALRADMDAVFDDAPDPVEFRSLVPGVRHVCGHDVHTTVLLGVAEALAPLRADLAGTVVFVFQPAEERATGARAMLDDGALRDGTPAAIFALHTAPLAVGTIGTKPGTLLAARDDFNVTLTAASGSSAEEARAALTAAAAAVTQAARGLTTLAPDARFRPTAAEFRLVQRVEDAAGATPRTWVVSGRLGVSGDSLARGAEAALRAAIAAEAARGVSGRLDYRRGAIPGATNDPALEARARGVLAAALGDSAVVVSNTVPPAFSEDFGAFQALAPGIMLWLGVGPVGMPHSPGYVADERSIAIGARALSALALDALSRGR